jgi:hypothetical protein
LTYTITNPAANVDAELGVAFFDNLPAGIGPALPSGLADTCGGTPFISGQQVTLAGGTVAVSSSCSVSLNVVGNMLGSFTDSAGPVSSTNGGTGNSATATIDVVSPFATAPLPAALSLFATGLGLFGFIFVGSRLAIPTK